MADGNEDLRADDLPGPAYESYESMELACPAERSGHVAVGDGRHMFVWGGYKVSGRPAAAGVARLDPESGSAGWGGGRAAARTPLSVSRLCPSVHFLASGLLLTGPLIRADAPGLLSLQPSAYGARGGPGRCGRWSVVWGRARWAAHDYDTCYVLKGGARVGGKRGDVV